MVSEDGTPLTRNVKLIGAVALIVVAVAILIYSSMGDSARVSNNGQAFYTVDDGVTWFADSASLLPPFDHGGKPAVQVVVLSNDGGKTKYAGFLQRYTAEAKKHLDAKSGSAVPSVSAYEVKKPGAAASWVNRNSREGMMIVNGPTAKAGTPAEIVMP